ncbi:MAG: MarR family winged helix-turn-helix transcriptional regulator, partial [Halanaerobiales bacterium]
MEETTKEIDNLMRNIHKLLVKYTKDHLKSYSLTVPRFKTLWTVSINQPINMSNLHNKMYLAKSTLTVIVDRLVEDGLLKRHRDSHDRRVVLVEITEQGQKYLDELLQIRQNYLQHALAELDQGEKKHLIELLSPILSKLKKDLKED